MRKAQKLQKCFQRQQIPGRITTIYCGASVEPTLAVNPRDPQHMVAAWQQDRISNAGALEIAVAFTRNGGKTWNYSSPHLQICFPGSRGIAQRISDSWLSFSSDGTRVYLCNTPLNATREEKTGPFQSGVVVNMSRNGGESWGPPHILVSSMNYISEPSGQFANVDKSSITADPHDPKRVISVWASFNPASSFHGDAYASQSFDRGKTWSMPCPIYDPFPDLTFHHQSNGIQNDAAAQNNVVVIHPRSGTWLLFTTRYYARPTATNEQYVSDTFPFRYTLNDVAVVPSHDGGHTWSPSATTVIPAFVNQWVYTGGYTYTRTGKIAGGVGTRMRNDSTLPFYAVHPRNGNLYVVNMSGTFRRDKLPQIGLVSSLDGGHSWSRLIQVNRTPSTVLNPQAFEPAVAITECGRVGVFYVDFRNDDKSNPNRTKMDAWFAIYQEREKGRLLEFVTEVRLSKKSYVAQDGPETTQGNMVDADYQFVVAQGKRFYVIHTQARKRQSNTPPVQVYPEVYLDTSVHTYPVVTVIQNTRTSAYIKRSTRLSSRCSLFSEI